MRNISTGGSAAREAVEADAQRFRLLVREFARHRCLRDPLRSIADDTVDLSPPQVHALIALGVEGSLTMGELARRGGVTDKTITGVVDRMEAAGLARRERDREDRRIVHVRLTSSGAAVYQRLDRHMTEHLLAVLSLIDPVDRRHLLRIFEGVRDRLLEAQPDSTSQTPAKELP